MKLLFSSLLLLATQTAAFAPAATTSSTTARPSMASATPPDPSTTNSVSVAPPGPGFPAPQRVGPPPAPGMGQMVPKIGFRDMWGLIAPTTIQGSGALRTWPVSSPTMEYAQVLMKTDELSLNVDLDLWEGPDNTPQKSNVYIGFGNKRPIRAIIATPKGSDTSGSNTIAIRNIGPLEYPVQAYVEADHDGSAGLGDIVDNLADMGTARILQGGSIDTFPLGPAVESTQVMITTDGRPLKCTLELLQGPNSVKIKIEHYSEDGMIRPLFVIFETPGFGNVVRVMNTAPAEFPLSVACEPYIINTDMMT